MAARIRGTVRRHRRAGAPQGPGNPHHGRRFGWFSTVSHWDVEQQEVQIDFEGERVRDIQARIRRTRAQAAGA